MSKISASILRMLLICVILLLGVTSVFAFEPAEKPFLHPLFSDNMVIQRDVLAPIWGWTKPGEKITVSMCGKSATAVADAQGKWMAKIGPFTAGGPYSLVVKGPKTEVAMNVLVGDVWICSGQSNMQWEIDRADNGQAEIAAANHPNIRLFKVPMHPAVTPLDTIFAKWHTCSPETVSGFTAVGYFFGRQLNRDLNVPIGLIEAAWGGTTAEAWTSAEALSTVSGFSDKFYELKRYIENNDSETYQKQLAAWWDSNDPSAVKKLNWESPTFDDSNWGTIYQPKYWDSPDLEYFNGIVWMRKDINIPVDPKGKPATLEIGPVDDGDSAFINGVKVGETLDYTEYRRYVIPAGVLKQGKNTVAVRVLDAAGYGGMYNSADQFAIRIGDVSIPLAGDWRYKIAAPMAGLSECPQNIYKVNHNVVTSLYNGMIAPLTPFAIKGAIWYQGESNSDRPVQYRTLLPTMIDDWRSRFNVGKFPFLIVQLPNFMDPVSEPVQSGWAELREAQLLTACKHENCGLAVTIDIGDPKNLHPTNKQDVSNRLALVAEGVAYDHKIDYSGPIYKKMKIEGNTIRLYFDHVGGGLVSRGSDKLQGFAITGADKYFVWADAVIDGDTIKVSAPSVDKPIAVRYDWANSPSGNLYNKANLPASPFRTDSD